MSSSSSMSSLATWFPGSSMRGTRFTPATSSAAGRVPIRVRAARTWVSAWGRLQDGAEHLSTSSFVVVHDGLLDD